MHMTSRAIAGGSWTADRREGKERSGPNRELRGQADGVGLRCVLISAVARHHEVPGNSRGNARGRARKVPARLGRPQLLLQKGSVMEDLENVLLTIEAEVVLDVMGWPQ